MNTIGVPIILLGYIGLNVSIYSSSRFDWKEKLSFSSVLTIGLGILVGL